MRPGTREPPRRRTGPRAGLSFAVSRLRGRWRSWALNGPRAPVYRLLRKGALVGGPCLLMGTLAALLLAHLVPLPERLSLPPSTVVAFADGSPAYVFLSPDDKYRMAVNPAEVDPDYLKALLRFEDKRFYYHPGVDPLALVRALVLNLRNGRVVSGASTLTLQLVRLLEARPRTMRSKVMEALRATQLEIRLSKEEILAAYLTYTPFGGNVEGVRAASLAYFGHDVRDLAPEEIATLLAVPQKPSRRFPSPANARRLRQARDRIAVWLERRGALRWDNETGASSEPGEGRADWRAQKVPTQLKPLPRRAPHAAFWLRRQHPNRTRIDTTLDRGVQRMTAQRLREAQEEMASRGIYNAAAVVLERPEAPSFGSWGSARGEGQNHVRVRALVGNFNFFDTDNGGQIPGFDTPRSPGSALKPFIYALAVDRGLALPGQLVADVPVIYGDYAPHNYDGGFSGLVALEEALAESLNVPFVRLLARVGVEDFLDTLRSAGVKRLNPTPGHYGLSAAIGALEVTPLELASLYVVLAADGRAAPVSWLLGTDAPAPPGRASPPRVFSSGAAYLTRRALSRRDRPDFPQRRRFTAAPSQIHWKTGTSYGHRDAWAAGSGGRYTAAVWLGNFDNGPSVDLVGAEAAGPLLFDLLEAAADRSLPPTPDRPSADLKPVEVCAYSGYPPTAACGDTRSVLALGSRVPTRTCSYHVALDVDLDTGLALNPGCRGGRRYETRSFLNWPASIRRFLGERDQWLPRPPSLAPGCQATRTARLSILSPPAGQVVVLLPGLAPSSQEVPLEAESHDLGIRLSWFVDGEYLGTRPADQRLWWTPRPGVHEVYVVDEAGRSRRRRLEVRPWRSGSE